MAAHRFMLSPGWMTQVLRQGVALGLCATMLPFTQLSLQAQDGPPQQYPVQDPGGDPNQQPAQGYEQQPAYEPQGPQQLEQLVAPIALYPDSLVAQTLAAATYPQQVQEASSWMQQYGNQPADQLAQQVNAMPWDPSVKALTQFPTVLDMLARGQQWTVALGNAYYNQPADVMTAVQSMRFRAREAGQLRSTQQQVIVDDGPEIVIQPVNPEVVYVPYYDPWAVYGEPITPFYGYYRPLPPPGFALGIGLGIGFGIGIGIGAFAHFGWGYHAWAPNWRSNTIIVNRNTYISRSTTVINNGHYGAYNQGFDHAGPRGFAHASFNRSAPLYNGRPVGPQNRPAPSFSRPAQAGVNRPGGQMNRPGTPGAVNRPGPTGFQPGARPASPGFQQGARPGAQPARPAGQMNRPAGQAQRPENGAPINRPAAPNYNRPATGGYGRPSGTTSGYSRPSGTNSRPAPAAARPQPAPQRSERPAAPRAQARPGAGEKEHHH